MAVPPQLQKIVSKLRAYPVAIAAFGVSFLLAVVIFLRASSLEGLEGELQQTEGEWDRISGNLKRARDLEEHLIRIKEAQAQIEARLMDPEERALNYDYFYSVEKAAGVRLMSLNQGGVIDTKNATIAGIREFKEYQLIGYNLSLEGSFDQVIKFLSLLNNGKYFARISNFNVSRAQQASAGTLAVNLQLQVLGPSHES